MADGLSYKPLPPKDAVKYFEGKGFKIGFDWRDVWQEEHARAFTAAKVMRLDILQDIRSAVDEAIKNGVTFQQFQKNLKPTLQKKGWWGKKDLPDPITGQIVKSQLGSPRRLRTIYDVNLRMARAAGDWSRMSRADNDDMVLVYKAVRDESTRHSHLSWHNIALPMDHDFWNTHFPPNGWNCRCRVVLMSRRRAERLGLKLDDPNVINAVPWTNKRTGEVLFVPEGIDPGFGYNVGKAHMRGIQPPPQSGPISTPYLRGPSGKKPKQATPPMTTAIRQVEAEKLLDNDITDEEAIAAFLKEFKANDKTVLFKDVLNEPLILDKSFFNYPDGSTKLNSTRRQSILLLAATLKQPDEIWWSWEKIFTNKEKTNYEHRLRRRYFARFDVEGKSKPMIVVMDVGKDGWKGVSAFIASKDNYLLNQRGGTLAYRRE